MLGVNHNHDIRFESRADHILPFLGCRVLRVVDCDQLRRTRWALLQMLRRA